LLLMTERPDVAQQNDVVFNSRGNTVHNLLSRRHSRHIRYQ